MKKHERMAEPKKIEGGLFRVTIRAEVEKRELIQRLEAASMHAVKVDGANILARWEAQLKNEKDGAKILAQIFENLPARTLNVVVVGEPRRISTTGDRIKIGVQVRLSVNQERWSAWFKTSRPYLEKLAKRTKSARWGFGDGTFKPNKFSHINFDNIREFTGKDWDGEKTLSDNPYDFAQLKVPPERRAAVLGGEDKWGSTSMTRAEIELALAQR